MLLYVDGEVMEIRPGELFTANAQVESRFLELVETQKRPQPEKKKRGRKPSKAITFEDINVSSST
jgi:hypothetical protein